LIIFVLLPYLSFNLDKIIERFSIKNETQPIASPLPNFTNINNNNIIINTDESKKNDKIKPPSPSESKDAIPQNTKIPSQSQTQNNNLIPAKIENLIIKNLKKFESRNNTHCIAFQKKFDESLEQSFKQTYSISIQHFYSNIENEIMQILSNNLPELHIIDKSALPKNFKNIDIENQKEALINNGVVAVIIIQLNENKIILTLKFVEDSSIQSLGVIELPDNTRDK